MKYALKQLALAIQGIVVKPPHVPSATAAPFAGDSDTDGTAWIVFDDSQTDITSYLEQARTKRGAISVEFAGFTPAEQLNLAVGIGKCTGHLHLRCVVVQNTLYNGSEPQRVQCLDALHLIAQLHGSCLGASVPFLQLEGIEPIQFDTGVVRSAVNFRTPFAFNLNDTPTDTSDDDA